MGWTHDGCPDEEEGTIRFAVMEGTPTMEFAKETLCSIFKLVCMVVNATCSRDFPQSQGS